MSDSKKRLMDALESLGVRDTLKLLGIRCDYDGMVEDIMMTVPAKDYYEIYYKYNDLKYTVNTLITSYREGGSISKLLDNIEELIKE